MHFYILDISVEYKSQSSRRIYSNNDFEIG